MMALQFLGPVIASVLYVIVFQKAGFRGAVLALAAAPVLGMALTYGIVTLMGYYGMGLMLLSLPLSLLPLLILAFMPWPPVVAPKSRSET